MNIRAALNQYKKTATTLAGLVVVAAVGMICWQAMAGDPVPGMPAGRAFYSADDGKTWFADAGAKVPPIDRGGKPAYRVHVFQVGTAPPAVVYMETFEPAIKAKLEKALSGHNAFIYGEASREMLVKRPGDKTWLKPTHPDYGKVIMSVPPDAKPVTPD